MSTTDPIQGRCLCGAVRFTLTPPTDFAAHCHCESCRRSHGAAFVTWTGVPLTRFAFDAGADDITWHRSSPTIEWGFCRHCGSSMLYRAIAEGHPEKPKQDRMYVTVASLETMDRAPSVHVSYEERVPWFAARDGLPKHRGKSDETVEE